MIRRQECGFTVLELMTTLAILVVVIGYAFGNTTSLTATEATASELKTIYHGFQLARETAVYRRKLVTVCPLNAQHHCSNNWNRQITIFIDPANARAVKDPKKIVATLPAPPMGKLTATAGLKHYFQFRPDGMTHGTLGHITYCPRKDDSTHAGRLILNLSGRLRYAEDQNGDGIIDGSNGKPIPCSDG